jgi:hypothetical protein
VLSLVRRVLSLVRRVLSLVRRVLSLVRQEPLECRILMECRTPAARLR